MKSKIPLLLILLIAFNAKAQQYTKTSNGVKANLGNTKVEVQFLNNDIVRIIKYAKTATFKKSSFSVIKKPELVAVNTTQNKDWLSLSSKTTTVKLNIKTGQIIFNDNAGKILLSEKQGSDSIILVKDNVENYYRVAQAFSITSDEGIYGLGQHQNGILNQRNIKIKLMQENKHTAIPYIYSTNKYGLFWDNYSTSAYEEKNNTLSFNSEQGDGIDYYFMNAKTADAGLALFKNLTGQAPMFPKWAMGYFQSKERYKSQEEVVDVVRKYRALKVPLDCIIQDWQYWGEDDASWSSTEFGNPHFANPKKMLDSLHDMNAHFIISIWPQFGAKTNIYKEFASKGMLYDVNFKVWPDKAQVYDAYNPEARDIYWKHLNKNIFSIGADGWWMDATEPEIMDFKPSDNYQKTYAGQFRKVRNAYPLLTTGGVYEHQRKVTDKKRVFILTRSAFAGQQRNGTVNWSGDISSTWDVFKAQIPGGLNMSMSGIPYWNTDIGGFIANKSYPKGNADIAFQELYVRWLQFGAFCPQMRSHGTTTPREIFNFGQKGYWAYDAIEKYINLRYQLMPYNYSTAWQVTSKGNTFMRPLAIDFPNDKTVYDIGGEYMYGKSILVCPVTAPMYTTKNDSLGTSDFSVVKKWPVYLPASTNWYNFYTNEKFAGGQTIQQDVPVDVLPLYVKAGSIIPMEKPMQYVGERKETEIDICVYPGADASFVLYEDENDNYNYEKGKYTTIEFKWNDAKKQLTIGDRKGSFNGMLMNRIFNIKIVGASKVIKYSGKQLIVR